MCLLLGLVVLDRLWWWLRIGSRKCVVFSLVDMFRWLVLLVGVMVSMFGLVWVRCFWWVLRKVIVCMFGWFSVLLVMWLSMVVFFCVSVVVVSGVSCLVISCLCLINWVCMLDSWI